MRLTLALTERLAQRVRTAIAEAPCAADGWEAAALLTACAAVALPVGFGSGFLQLDLSLAWETAARVCLVALLFPALAEELFFRVLLIPHRQEVVFRSARWLWSGASWLLFVASHPLKPQVLWAGGPTTFTDPTFLLLAALLGLACTLSYARSGSLWPPVLIHWTAVVVWLLVLGGYRRLHA
jgi:predicted Abi (CAAX) family protease